MSLTLRSIIEKVRSFYFLAPRAESIYALLARMYLEPRLAAEKAADPNNLTYHGFSAYSMCDEDGMIEELFRRIGTTNRQFFEFGCGNGLENNSTYLLFTGWGGVWLDGGEENIRSVETHFSRQIQSGKLKTKQTFITAENINALMRETGVDPEMDFLCIDIDGNDYWIWKAIEGFRPRAVVIEYNATFRPPHKIVQTYNPASRWNSTNYFGASLKALEELGREKGYALVGCNISGIDAFFVREDLVGNLFSAPFTAEHHYRPPHYDAIVRGFNRHPRGAGPYEIL
jgi:hypothetical protein